MSCKDSELIAEKVFSQHIDGLNHLLSSLNIHKNFLRIMELERIYRNAPAVTDCH